MVTIQYIEGACTEEIQLPEFSRAAVMERMELTEAELAAAKQTVADGGDDATDVTVFEGSFCVVVTVFNAEGEAFFFLGPVGDWVK